MVILLLLTLAAVNMPQLYGLQNKTVVIEQKTSSVLGKYLKGHVFKVTSKAENPQHCLADCWEENDRCQSFNFFPELAICELNDASNLTSPQNLIDKPNVVYLTNPVYGREKVGLYSVHHPYYYRRNNSPDHHYHHDDNNHHHHYHYNRHRYRHIWHITIYVITRLFRYGLLPKLLNLNFPKSLSVQLAIEVAG
jgi:hypothetical protein